MLPARTPNAHPLHKAVLAALKAWHQVDTEPGPLADLVLFQTTQQRLAASTQQTTNALLFAALEQMAEQYGAEAALLRARFLDNELIQTLAHQKNWSEATFFRKQQAALAQLTTTLLAMEGDARAAQRATLLARLEPVTYSDLFGVESQLEQLTRQLTRRQPPWLLALEGMGGMGKTALADRLARSLIEQNGVAAVGWVTARQSLFNLGGSIQTLPRPALTSDALIEALYTQMLGARPPTSTFTEMYNALQRRLKETPHVIFVDNLESVADVETLLPTLRQLADPTHFVLTTRHSLYAEADIYHFAVPELAESATLRLVRHEAHMRNLAVVTSAANSELQPIFQTVGGNPLALRLVVGQLHIHPLPTILADLRAAQSAPASALYTFIYRRAWEHLDELARNTLLIMPMVNEQGGDLELLAGISQLPPADLRQALDQLVKLNLVDGRGDLHTRRYTIHPLTRTFLHQQVIEWQAA